MKLQFIIVFITVITFSCSRYPADVERALELAGDNCHELELVIDHYKKIDDLQKLKAAEYLIANMPYRKSRVSDLDSFNYKLFDLIKKYDISQDQALDSLKDKHCVSFYYKKDVEIIKSKFLINNIDWAFKVWKEAPWGKNVSFNQFCKEILPYRVGSEPLEEWRAHYYNYFKPILDSLLKDDSPLSACQILYDTLVKKTWKYTGRSFADLGANILLENNQGGHCDTQTQFMTFVMRSVGIPGGIDSYLCSPDKMGGGHSWNYFRDTTGNIIDFNFEPCDPEYIRDKTGKIIDSDFEPIHIKNMSVTRKKGKVYRESFELNSNIYSLEISKLPITIKKSIWLSDVSIEYFGQNDISLEIKDHSKETVFLCVFNDKQWVAIDYMKIKNGKVKLNEIEQNVVYILGYSINNNIVTEGNPFIYTGKELKYFIADTSNFEKVLLTRKYSLSISMEKIRKYVVGGKFQVANKVNFKDAHTVHVISKEADMMYNTINLNIDTKYRFIRYLSADNGFCCMAEISFFSPDSEPLKGKIIGTDGTRWGNNAHTKFAVFDKDPLTYFVSKEPSGAWVGLDLNNPRKIGKIIYLFRNDDNSIMEGNTYELFYFSPKGWISCGVKQGYDQYLEYDNVPKNALLWLRNHTRGREERPFTYENGKQVWW